MTVWLFTAVTFQAYPGILPVSVRMCDVKIFIRQIEASGEADMVVDYRDFTVIPVVHKYV